MVLAKAKKTNDTQEKNKQIEELEKIFKNEETEIKPVTEKEQKSKKKHITSFNATREFTLDIDQFITQMKLVYINSEVNTRDVFSRSKFFELYHTIIKEDYEKKGENSLIRKKLDKLCYS